VSAATVLKIAPFGYIFWVPVEMLEALFTSLVFSLPKNVEICGDLVFT
jgi:hypothetical protein